MRARPCACDASVAHVVRMRHPIIDNIHQTVCTCMTVRKRIVCWRCIALHRNDDGAIRQAGWYVLAHVAKPPAGKLRPIQILRLSGLFRTSHGCVCVCHDSPGLMRASCGACCGHRTCKFRSEAPARPPGAGAWIPPITLHPLNDEPATTVRAHMLGFAQRRCGGNCSRVRTAAVRVHACSLPLSLDASNVCAWRMHAHTLVLMCTCADRCHRMQGAHETSCVCLCRWGPGPRHMP